MLLSYSKFGKINAYNNITHIILPKNKKEGNRMFEENYSASSFIKKLAKIIYYASFVIAALSVFAAIIILCINAEYMWMLSLSLISISGAGILVALITANLIWGFAEIIDNTKAVNKVVIDSTNFMKDSSQLPPL